MNNKQNVIPLQDAERYAARWRGEEGTYNSHRELHAFVIPKIDLLEVLTEQVDAVRGYLGVDDNGVEKLMFVGTKYDAATNTYYDMLPGRSVGDNSVYDMTMPCPNACDPTSPLNNL